MKPAPSQFRFPCALLACLMLTVWTANAGANESPLVTPAPARASKKSVILKVIGGMLVGLGAVATVVAGVEGGSSFGTSIGCGLGDHGGCTPSQKNSADTAANLAVGMAVVAGLTNAVGFPLIAYGEGKSREERKHLSLSVAPTFAGQTANGATAAVSLRF